MDTQTTTAAPAPVTTTATPPPAAVATTATPAPAEGPSDLAQAVAAYFGTEGAATTERAAAVEPGAHADAPPPVVEAAPVAPPAPVEAPPPPKDDLDERLARLDRESRAAAVARKERARQAEATRKAAEEAERAKTANAADLDLAKRIREARASGKKLEPLLAAGFTLEELRSGYFVDALTELEAAEAPPTVTRAEAEAIAEAKAQALIKQREDAAKAEAERLHREATERTLAEAEEVIAEAKVYYKAGDYPLLKHQNPTKGDLVKFKAQWEAANPGRVLRGKELIDEAEKTLRTRHASVKAEIERMEKLLAPPAAPPPAVAITPAGTATVSPHSVSHLAPPPAPAPDETYDESIERMKREFEAKWG
jgi:hypothetical protein